MRLRVLTRYVRPQHAGGQGYPFEAGWLKNSSLESLRKVLLMTSRSSKVACSYDVGVTTVEGQNLAGLRDCSKELPRPCCMVRRNMMGLNQ
ncbi:hypothetical protein B5X24_HaOG205998 [Helicoverpa armigera]|uniref:Uncharacterized protein n=1 Tax=Helicoverpa armigera TaxID=29058 RepID=A0A2W1BMQ2_HELAM|nr:hypothetical protein B5X24_HaOG205998 [Helicoverpa armigera]